MDKAMLAKVLEAHYWAHREMFRGLQSLTEEQYTSKLDSSFPSIRETVAHIVAGEEFLLGGLPGAAVTRSNPAVLATVAEAEGRMNDLEAFARSYVEELGEGGLDQPATLTFSSGRTAQVKVWQVLHQLVTHGPYHRGQVVTLLHQVGAKPVKTDVLMYYMMNP